MSIAEFLTARLDEREAAIRDNVKWWWENFERLEVYTSSGIVTGGEDYVAPFLDPVAVLADVAAKRAIVTDYQIVLANNAIDDAVQPDEVRAAAQSLIIKTLRMVLLRLAAPYADHPDYPDHKAEWAP